MKHDERELRALFEAERAADARLAPSFAEIMTDRGAAGDAGRRVVDHGAEHRDNRIEFE